MAITLGGGGSASQIDEIISLNNTANTVTLDDGRVYLKGGVYEDNLATYPLAFSKYNPVFTFSVSAEDTHTQGGTWDGTHYWVTGNTNNTVYKYTSAGVYTGTSFSISTQSTDPEGITWDGTYLWVLDATSNKVWKYNSSGAYQSVFFSVNAQATTPKDITWDGTFFWVLNNTGAVYKYNSSGVYQSVTWSASSEMSNPRGGLAWDGTYFWVADYNTGVVYKYNSAGVYQNDSITIDIYSEALFWNGTGLVSVNNIPRVSVYIESNGVPSATSLGAQNYVRVA